jgi:hypothetical protein
MMNNDYIAASTIPHSAGQFHYNYIYDKTKLNGDTLILFRKTTAVAANNP